MKTNKKSVAMGFAALLFAMVNASNAQQDEVFPSFNSKDIVWGANLTWRNYVEWWNKTQGTPLRGDTELGTNLWDAAIARLKPAYVYTHGVNIVIVRSREGEDETGFYVALGISSGPGPSDDQFTRMVIAPQAGGTVFTFRRRGHFEGPRTASLAETAQSLVIAARGATGEASVRSRLAARTASETATNAHGFGIFMPREDVLSRTPDVEERIRLYLQSKPGEIPLAKDPLISDRDIESYDWNTHTLAVDASVIQRIHAPLVWGTPFVVVADGEPVYVGAFYTLASSQSCPVPVILTDRFLNRTNSLVIQRAYAAAAADLVANDPRSDARIKNALQALGKLKE